MAQIRWWNWQDDDSTFRLNHRDLIVMPYGRYCGFSAVLAAGLNLTLTQVGSGKTKVDQALATSPELGIWKTKQGGVVQEDSDIVLPISTGDPTNPRIDLIIGEHEYVVAVGGATALYKVIQGTPAASPVAPSLTDPNKQVILGTLYVPASTTNLNGAGVVYTPTGIPNFLGDSTIAHLDQKQIWLAEQVISNLTAEWGIAYLDTGGEFIDLTKDETGTPLTGAVLADNLTKNKFVIKQIGLTANPVNSISPYPSSITNEAKNLEILTFYSLRLLESTNFFYDGDDDLIIRSGEVLKVTSIKDTLGVGTFINSWAVIKGGEAKRNAINDFNKTQIFNRYGGTLSSTLLSHNFAGNYATISTSIAQHTIESIEEADFNGGTYLVVRAIGEPLELKHDAVVASGKPLFLPNEQDIIAKSDKQLFLFMEDQNYWRLVGDYDPTDIWHYVGDPATGLGTTFGGYGNAFGLLNLRFKKIEDDRVRIEGVVTKTNKTITTDNIVFTLPAGYIPVDTHQLPLLGVMHETPAGTLYNDASVFITILSTTGIATLNSYSVYDTLSGKTLNAGQGNISLTYPLK